MSTRKTPSSAEVAPVLGMKEREVVDVRTDADGTLARTHDGNWTLIRDGGVLEFLGQDLGDRALTPDGAIQDAADEVVDLAELMTEEASKKPAPKGRVRA